MIDCTIIYPPLGEGFAGSGVVLGADSGGNTAIETYIAGCTFNSSSTDFGGVGLQIYSVEHVRVVNTRIQSFAQAIVISPIATNTNSRKLYFGNVSAFGQNGSVLIQPQNGNWVGEVWFHACELTPGDSGTTYQGAGVILDPINGAGGGGNIDQVRFNDCYVCQWLGPGLLILGAAPAQPLVLSNIEIVGGYYSLNGQNPASGLPSAGIATQGTVSGLRISDAACNNSIFFNGSFLTPEQDYGISIGPDAENVFVRTCDLRGNLTQPMAPLSGVTNVQITDCAAYNDAGAIVTTTAPAALSTFNGQTYGYYGPVEFYVSGGNITEIDVDGHRTGLTSGSFYLMPLETAELKYPVGPPPTFLMIGK